MALKRYVLIALAAAAALLIALTFVVTAQGEEAPTLSMLNTGAMPMTSTELCDYTISPEQCQITVQNDSTYAVKITALEINGNNPYQRYNITNTTCAIGNTLAASGGSCVAEIRLMLNRPECNIWRNHYLIKVEQVGVSTNFITSDVRLNVGTTG